MPLILSELDNQKAKELLTESKGELSIDFDTFKKMYNGDHWRDGLGWTGPKPDAGDSSSSAVLARIKRQFVSKNVIKETVSRHESGVFGKQPKISITPNVGMKESDSLSEEQLDQIAQLEHDIMQWFREKKVLHKLKQGVRQSLYGTETTFRFYIPKSFMGDDNSGRLQDVETISDAFKMIYIDSYDIDTATVYEEEGTLRQVGIYISKDEDDKEIIEISYVDDESGDGKTVLKSFLAGSEEVEGGQTEPIQLHGNIMMYKVEREPIISSQVIQNQDLLNKALTMWSANMDWSGFVERLILNGMPPGSWGYDVDERKWVYEESGELKTGPATTTFVSGIPKFDDEGRIQGMSQPQVQFRDPIEPDTFKVTLESAYRNILEETHQVHVLMNSDAGASGISRREARSDYEESLKDSKGMFDLAGKWIIETLLYLAQFLIQQESDEPDWKVEFSANINVGPISQEDSERIREEVKDGLKSKETAMSELGIDDVEAELARIDTAADVVTSILDVLTKTQLVSPTLYRVLFERLIEDVEILSSLEEAQINSILSEIEASANQQVQQGDFMGGLRAGGSTGEEEEEEVEEDDEPTEEEES